MFLSLFASIVNITSIVFSSLSITYILKQSIVILTNFTSNFNKAVLISSFEILNDGLHSFSANVTAETFVVITKIWIYVKISVPEDINDKKYGKQIFQTVVDVEKLFKGISGNFVMKTIGNSLIKSIDNDFKLPMQKVRK